MRLSLVAVSDCIPKEFDRLVDGFKVNCTAATKDIYYRAANLSAQNGRRYPVSELLGWVKFALMNKFGHDPDTKQFGEVMLHEWVANNLVNKKLGSKDCDMTL